MTLPRLHDTGGGKWKLDLRDMHPFRLRFRGRDGAARLEFIRDPNAVDRLLHLTIASNPRLTSFVPFVDRDGIVDPGNLDYALSHDFCTVRWPFDDPAES
jgi:hypothetical protein